jgi:CheY-like chemotaxis protein
MTTMMVNEKKILVAENQSIDAAYLKLLLEREGWKVDVVDDGSKVLEFTAKYDYSFILMNISLTNIDGLEATKQIRVSEKKSGTHIPIVGLTAYSLSEETKRCLGAGMDYCIAKPVYKRQLSDIIEKIDPNMVY